MLGIISYYTVVNKTDKTKHNYDELFPFWYGSDVFTKKVLCRYVTFTDIHLLFINYRTSRIMKGAQMASALVIAR